MPSPFLGALAVRRGISYVLLAGGVFYLRVELTLLRFAKRSWPPAQRRGCEPVCWRGGAYAGGVQLPDGMVSFVFSDVEGSTRLARELGDEQFALVLDDHGRRLRACFDRHGGVVVGTQGDGFFVVFRNAVEAVAAVGEARAALEGLPLSVRFGVHTGVAVIQGGDYIGIDVHRAARISAAGHGGQVLVSAATKALVAGDWVDLGEHLLSDLAAPERLYQLGPGEFPPLRSLHARRLPEASTRLVGRDRELADVGALVGEGAYGS